MINYLNFENGYQKVQPFQQVPSNRVIIDRPDEVNALAGVVQNLSRKALIDEIETISESNDENFIGRNIDIYV